MPIQPAIYSIFRLTLSHPLTSFHWAVSFVYIFTIPSSTPHHHQRSHRRHRPLYGTQTRNTLSSAFLIHTIASPCPSRVGGRFYSSSFVSPHHPPLSRLRFPFVVEIPFRTALNLLFVFRLLSLVSLVCALSSGMECSVTRPLSFK